MIVPPGQFHQLKDGFYMRRPEPDESLGPLRLALPTSQIKAFVDRLTIREEREIAPKIVMAMFAVNRLHLDGFEDEMAKKCLALVEQLPGEHPNKRYREVMRALRGLCKSKSPDLPAVVWTLMEAQGLLLEAAPDLSKGWDAYAERVGISPR